MNNALFYCPTTGEIVRLEYTNGVLDLMVPYNADKSTLTAQGLSEAEAEEKLADFERSVDATWNWCDGVARRREFSSLEEAKEYLGSLGVTDIDFSDDQIFPDFPQIIICGNLMLQVSDLSQLISANMVLEATKKISMQVLSAPPRGEEYKGLLLLPTICGCGWRCDFSFPDGSLRQGATSHPFPAKALDWGKELVDTGRVYQSQNPRQFADEPLVTRPFFTLAESLFGSVLANGDKSHWLLANYLLLHFGDRGRVDFWDDFLASTVRLGPRQLTKRLKDLVRLGIVRYIRWPNRNCPTSYYLGPAWLSVEGLTLTSDELLAIESGEMHDVENGYFWGIPFGERGNKAETARVQQGDALVRIPNDPDEPIWHSTWKEGLWTHRRKASADAELELPIKKNVRLVRRKNTALPDITEQAYKGYLLKPQPDCRAEPLIWFCHLKLSDGRWLCGEKGHDSAEDALGWAKQMVDISDNALSSVSRAAKQQTDTQVHLFQHADLVLEKYLPKPTNTHKSLLKYLILLIENKGDLKLWEHFLALGLTLPNQQLLRWCRDLAKAGLVRYCRFGSTRMTRFYLGPAWLSVPDSLNSQELEAIALGEVVATYRPWWNKDESYPGEKFGWPHIEQDNRSLYKDLRREPGTQARFQLKQKGSALVRVPTKPNYPTWYSTWQDSAWTHECAESTAWVVPP